MRLFNFLIFIKSKHFLSSGSKTCSNSRYYFNCMLQTSLKINTTNLRRNFMIYHSVSKIDDTYHSLTVEKKTAKLKKNKDKETKVSVIIRHDVEKVMTLSEAEKFAKTRNCKLVEVEDSKKDKLKFILEKESKVFEEDVKNKGKDKKHILLREKISFHDLQIKINYMKKCIEKGNPVFLVIESTTDQNKLNQILDEINKSTLKDFLLQKKVTKRGINIMFEKKIPKTDSVKTESEKIEVKNENVSKSI